MADFAQIQLFGTSTWEGCVIRFGFNGKELDAEGMGGGSSTYDYGFRVYNAALGKFLCVDPLFKTYPWFTPYQFASNMPVAAIDLDGLEALIVIRSPWYQDEILKAIESGDVQRAVYLASKSLDDPAKDDYSKGLFKSDFAGTFNYHENNPDGLSVYGADGKLFNIQYEESSNRRETEEDNAGFWRSIGEFFGLLDEGLAGSNDKNHVDKGGIMFTSVKGQNLEKRAALDKTKVEGPINLDELLGVISTTKAGAAGAASTVLQGIKKVVNAGRIGGELQRAYRGEKPTLDYCPHCGQEPHGTDRVIVDSSGNPVDTIPDKK